MPVAKDGRHAYRSTDVDPAIALDEAQAFGTVERGEPVLTCRSLVAADEISYISISETTTTLCFRLLSRSHEHFAAVPAWNHSRRLRRT